MRRLASDRLRRKPGGDPGALDKYGEMTSSQQPYLACVKSTLTAAMCLQSFGCQDVERHNRPEVWPSHLTSLRPFLHHSFDESQGDLHRLYTTVSFLFSDKAHSCGSKKSCMPPMLLEQLLMGSYDFS